MATFLTIVLSLAAPTLAAVALESWMSRPRPVHRPRGAGGDEGDEGEEDDGNGDGAGAVRVSGGALGLRVSSGGREEYLTGPSMAFLGGGRLVIAADNADALLLLDGPRAEADASALAALYSGPEGVFAVALAAELRRGQAPGEGTP